MIDLLVAFQFLRDKREQRSYVKQMVRVTHALCYNYPTRREKLQKLKKKFQSELSLEGVRSEVCHLVSILQSYWQLTSKCPNITVVRWMKKKSPFVSDIARLAKFWCQTVLFIGCGSGKSFLIELIAVKAAIETESKTNVKDKYSAAFENFLTKMINFKTLIIIFEDLYKKSDVVSDIRKQRPLVLNPVNQYQNVMEVANDDFIEEKNILGN